MTEEKDPLQFYAALTAGTGMLGLVAAWFLPSEGAGRLGAFLGVGAAVFSGAVALPLKARAMERSLDAALKMLGLVFGIRLLLVGAGLVWLIRTRAGPVPFVVGFFGVYFVLQWIEISYVLAEQKRRGGGT